LNRPEIEQSANSPKEGPVMNKTADEFSPKICAGAVQEVWWCPLSENLALMAAWISGAFASSDGLILGGKIAVLQASHASGSKPNGGAQRDLILAQIFAKLCVIEFSAKWEIGWYSVFCTAAIGEALFGQLAAEIPKRLAGHRLLGLQPTIACTAVKSEPAARRNSEARSCIICEAGIDFITPAR
jgi:hypothetical protein